MSFGSEPPAGDPNFHRDISPTGVDAREMGERLREIFVLTRERVKTRDYRV